MNIFKQFNKIKIRNISSNRIIYFKDYRLISYNNNFFKDFQLLLFSCRHIASNFILLIFL